MERSVLGRTNQRSFIVTLGGAVFVYPVEKKKGDAFVKYALDSGVNHIDVARASRDEIGEALRFTLSQPVTTAATSSDIEIARIQIEIAENFHPMGLDEQRKLLMKTSNYRPLFPRSKEIS